VAQVFASVGAGEAEEALGVSRALRLPSFAPLGHKTAQECLDHYQIHSINILLIYNRGIETSLYEEGSNMGKGFLCGLKIHRMNLKGIFCYSTSECI